VLGEGPAPVVMNRETKHDHLEGVSLLSAGLTPGVEHVAAIVEVTQVGLGVAHRPEILKHLKHVAQFSTTSVIIVSPHAQSLDVCPPRTSRVSWRHSALKALDMSNLIITSGSEGSELSAAYIAERILAQWEAPSWGPAVCKKFSYVDVKIREIGPRTAFAAGETATPAFAADDVADTPTVFGRFLECD
jgi:hypothetical protein